MSSLQPLRLPGNAQRRALAWAPEIQRLRSEGYTVAAIQEALAAEGVLVSWSTVQREASRPDRVGNRQRTRSSGEPGTRASSSGATLAQTNSVPKKGSSPASVERESSLEKDTRSPQEIAAEFMKGVNTNPLLQPKKGQ